MTMQLLTLLVLLQSLGAPRRLEMNKKCKLVLVGSTVRYEVMKMYNGSGVTDALLSE